MWPFFETVNRPNVWPVTCAAGMQSVEVNSGLWWEGFYEYVGKHSVSDADLIDVGAQGSSCCVSLPVVWRQNHSTVCGTVWHSSSSPPSGVAAFGGWLLFDIKQCKLSQRNMHQAALDSNAVLLAFYLY